MDLSDDPDAVRSKIRSYIEGVLVVEGPGPWPSVISRNGETYFRFHDFIYTSKPVDELSREQILAICALRGELSTNAQIEQNRRVRETFGLVTPVYKPSRLLEIGPGTRPLYDAHTTNFTYELADFDPDVVKQLVRDGYAATLFDDNMPLKQADNIVDLVFAIFVFQFPVSGFQVAELVRVLGPAGLMIANVYRRPPSSRVQLRKQFEKHRCEVDVISLGDGIGHQHEYWLIGPDLSKPSCVSVGNLLRNR